MQGDIADALRAMFGVRRPDEHRLDASRVSDEDLAGWRHTLNLAKSGGGDAQ